MNRRTFIKSLPGIALILTDFRGIFARALPGLFPPETTELTVYTSSAASSITIPIRWQNAVPYVPAQLLAGALNYNTYFNEERKKLVLYLPQNKVVVTGKNPFVIVDSQTLQMPVSCLLYSNDIYVPLPYLIPLINQYANINFTYDERLQILRVSDSRFNVAGVEVDSRDNGVVIRIRTSRSYKIGEMSVDKRNDWLHVDLFGATADVARLTQKVNTGPVREVKAFQFENLLSVAFRLSQYPIAKEIYQDEANSDVVVVLRYQEQLAETDSPKEPDQASVDNNRPAEPRDDDIQQQLEKERKRWLIDTIVIDPGHGGKDPGAIGVGGVREKDIVLAVGLKLGSLIERRLPGVKVIYTRKNDTFVELRKRTQIANENQAKVFISIHANANRSNRPAGFETYLLGPSKGAQASNVAERENSVIKFESSDSQAHYRGINAILAGLAQTAFMRQSENLAGNVQAQMGTRMVSLKMNDRGVKQAGFWVMVGAAMPSILVETGFITNKFDARILKTAAHQQKIAEGIFSGLQQFKSDYENAI